MINSCIGKTNDKSTIIDHLCVENIDITDSKKIANEFGTYFSTVGDHYANKIKDPNKKIESYLKVIPRNTKRHLPKPNHWRGNSIIDLKITK